MTKSPLSRREVWAAFWGGYFSAYHSKTVLILMLIAGVVICLEGILEKITPVFILGLAYILVSLVPLIAEGIKVDD